MQKKAKKDEEEEESNETPTAEELAKNNRIETLGDDVQWSMDIEAAKVDAAYLKKMQQVSILFTKLNKIARI